MRFLFLFLLAHGFANAQTITYNGTGSTVTVNKPGASSSVNISTPTPEVNNLIFISGQSNAQGLAWRSDLWTGAYSTITPSLTREFQRVYIWNPTASAWQKLQVGQPAGFGQALAAGTGGGNELGQQGAEHPAGYQDGFGPEIGLAQRWEQENATGNLYIIKGAKGGTVIINWLKATGTLYNQYLTDYITPAIAALTVTPVRVGFVWMQGESDGATSTADYQTRLTTLMGDVLTDFLSVSTLKIIGKARNQAAIATAQQNYVNGDANARFINTTPYTMLSDNLHYAAGGMLQFGGADIYNAIFSTTGTITGL